jgi:AhpD family alkylhydroperoxidase
MSYHEPTDMAYARNIRKNTPAAFAAFAAFDDAALRHPDKVIPRKYTELMAIAVALTTQCVYCIDTHTATAKAEGATEQELAEVVMTASALRAGAGLAHGLMAMKMYDEGVRVPVHSH